MLFLIMGASGSGKSSALAGLQQQLPAIDWRDFDDAPEHASNTAQRQQITEYWLQLALRNQADGIHTGLAGTTVLGEVLACPSATAIVGLHALLLDCGDVARIERIRAREGAESRNASQDMLSWAAWLRMHASDPQWRQDVICTPAVPEMRWERWSAWRRGDPRWRVATLDNTRLTIDETVTALVAWIAQCTASPVNETPASRNDTPGHA